MEKLELGSLRTRVLRVVMGFKTSRVSWRLWSLLPSKERAFKLCVLNTSRPVRCFSLLYDKSRLVKFFRFSRLQMFSMRLLERLSVCRRCREVKPSMVLMRLEERSRWMRRGHMYRHSMR